MPEKPAEYVLNEAAMLRILGMTREEFHANPYPPCYAWMDEYGKRWWRYSDLDVCSFSRDAGRSVTSPVSRSRRILPYNTGDTVPPDATHLRTTREGPGRVIHYYEVPVA